ncbi:hypothetical protein CYMTET_4341 [Cymbomonas tetramitiformis]|uniref:Uncharacterized protein n=1 Tax=Cymbomonas tetramitiformis TaxID=36881 RepID=A0AAE0H1E1_9CHLO|nr:hypothetical protein CYMTET_4341 [Cymbomonas tetramitiformis]
MCALRSALHLLRQRQFTTGHDLVVPGGACAPGTKHDSDNFDISENECLDSDGLAYPHFPLSPGTSRDFRLVASGGAIGVAHGRLGPSIIAFAKCRQFIARTSRVFRLRPSRPPHTDASSSVVLGRFQFWPRKGIG